MNAQLSIDFSTSSPINVEKIKGQNKKIFEHLASGKTIDVFEAIHMGIFHLHSRISDLRNKSGVRIYDKMIKRENVDCKLYSLNPFE